MPCFDYKCKKCGHEFEQLLASHKSEPLPCPKCKSKDLERLITGDRRFKIKGTLKILT